jgi:hypothetical protein
MLNKPQAPAAPTSHDGFLCPMGGPCLKHSYKRYVPTREMNRPRDIDTISPSSRHQTALSRLTTARLKPSSKTDAARVSCQYKGTSRGVSGTNSCKVPLCRCGAIKVNGCRPQPMLASEASTKACVEGKVCRGSSTCRWHRAPHPTRLQIVLRVEHQAGCHWARLPAVTPWENGTAQKRDWLQPHSAWRPVHGCCTRWRAWRWPSQPPARPHCAANSWCGLRCPPTHSSAPGHRLQMPTRAGANQVARLSALTAMGSVTRATPSGARPGNAALQLLLQQTHTVHVLAQASAGLGGLARLPAHHQSTAHPLFQQPNALRYGGRRDMQRACRTLKTAFTNHCRQSCQRKIVKHEISFSKVGQ